VQHNCSPFRSGLTANSADPRLPPGRIPHSGVGDTKQEETRDGSPEESEAIDQSGKIAEGKDVDIATRAGTNDVRSDEDIGGRSTTAAPVYEVTDDEGHAAEVDTRDLKPEP
jgi:hypothetical protein